MVRSTISLWTRCLLLLLLFFSPGKAVDCPRPSPAGNVVLTDETMLMNEFPDGSDVTVECANGYNKDQGSDIITCTDGTWSEPQLICKKRDCGPPKPSPHLKYEKKEGTLFGARITPFCDKGYYLQGSSSRQCLATGWSGRAKCEYISTTVRYPETTETTGTSFRVVHSRNSTTTAPPDSKGLDYELPSSTAAGTEISDYTIWITGFSLVFLAFLVGPACLCYCLKRKGMRTRTAPTC
ncbi:complement factor H isoform X2 [Pygocentrus nattereri]|uniref:Sushi domain-containing protein n=1 Tax=Pygocentrus nattereri TaxID=42514 RepID=A0A3B4DPC8_PYGNA|nr:complement factor H isoform X2 [Pygocentrus nattereri]